MVSINKIATVLATCLVVNADKAPKVADSPAGAKYVAKFDKKISGSVEFSSASNGTVLVDVNLDNLPTSGGSFLYHVHEYPVPSDGNCTGAGVHLNPYHGNKTATEPDELEAGDLSGRHGKIEGTSIHTSYVDPYISLNPENKAFVGNLSVVVHYHNTTAITCANITSEAASPSSSALVSSQENGASGQGISSWAIGAAAALGLLM